MILKFNEWMSNKAPRFAASLNSYLSDYFQDQEEEKKEKERQQNWLYDYHVDVGDHEISDIYSNYKKAMDRRRPGSALDFDSFYSSSEPKAPTS